MSVSNDFKNAVKEPAKELEAYVLYDDVYPIEITHEDDLQGLRIWTETDLCKVVIRQAKVNYLGDHDFLDKYVNIGIGVVLPDTSTEFIDYGKFKVVQVEKKEGSDVTEATLYDKMYEALKTYELDPVYDITYPATVRELLEAICTKLDWTLATETFPNDDLELDGDYFVGIGMTYRDVLEDIAEVSGTIIKFNYDNELELVTVPKTGTFDTLDENLLNSYKVQPKWGVLNSLVLSRMPQEDNIVFKDDTSIETNGLTELKIQNNIIVDRDREAYIETIFDALKDLEFYPFEITTSGFFYFDIGQRLELVNPQSESREVVVLGYDIRVGMGTPAEKIFAKVPQATTTDYQTAGIIGRTIKDTQIIVDKQKGEIQILTSDVSGSLSQISLTIESITSAVNQAIELGDVNADHINDLQENLTQLQQTADALELAVSGIGGTNLLKNSVGLKGDIRDWQILDSGGNPVDARNDATIIDSTDVQVNSESGSGIRLQDQFILQTFPTIVGESYTLYFRYKSNADATLNVTGIGNITLPTSADWEVFKYMFVAGSPTTTIRLENTTGQTITFTDLIVKLGDANGWMQAPNEVYGRNYRFDKDGFQITSLTDTFKSVLDNQKLAVYDTAGDKLIMFISKDSGIVTSLTAQDEFIVQRYENPSKSLRIIPTSTGAMLVIND